MIALGLAVELFAVALLIMGLLRSSAGTGTLWASIAAVLVGLCIAAIGVMRARPPRRPWLPAPPSATTTGDAPAD